MAKSRIDREDFAIASPHAAFFFKGVAFMGELQR